MLENLIGKSLVCKNTYAKIFRLRVTKAVYMRRQLHLSIKQMGKIQRKGKRCWMRELKAMEPHGLNIADSVQSTHTLFYLFIGYHFRSTTFYSSLELQLLRLIIYLSFNNLYFYFYHFFVFHFFFLSILPLFNYNQFFKIFYLHDNFLFKFGGGGAGAGFRLC